MEIKIIWASIFSEQNFFAKFRVEAWLLLLRLLEVSYFFFFFLFFWTYIIYLTRVKNDPDTVPFVQCFYVSF